MGPHAAVVGRPDNRSGQAPVAYIVTTGAVSAQEIGEWVSPRLAPDKRPIEYHTVEQVPRTPSGKLLRRHLHQPDTADT